MEGREYQWCTMADHSQSWCSIDNNQWRPCSESCPGYENSTGTCRTAMDKVQIASWMIYRFNKKNVRGITYELNKFLTADRVCTTKYFWKKLYRSFAFNLVNYSRHSESLNIRKNSEIEDKFPLMNEICRFSNILLRSVSSKLQNTVIACKSIPFL